MSEKKIPDREPGMVEMLAGIVLFAAIAVSLALVPVSFSNPEWKQADPYSLLNAGVSALAFAAVIQSLRYQQHQLKLQRRELRLQRRDLHQSLTEYKEMAKAQKSSDQRLFFTAYLNALDALRELNLQPPKANHEFPSSVLPAVQQRAVKKQLIGLLDHLSKEGQSLYNISAAKDEHQEFLENFARNVASLSNFCAFHSGHSKFDFPQMEEYLSEIRSLIPQCRKLVKQPNFLNELEMEIDHLQKACSKNTFVHDDWAMTTGVQNKCILIMNIMMQ